MILGKFSGPAQLGPESGKIFVPVEVDEFEGFFGLFDLKLFSAGQFKRFEAVGSYVDGIVVA